MLPPPVGCRPFRNGLSTRTWGVLMAAQAKPCPCPHYFPGGLDTSPLWASVSPSVKWGSPHFPPRLA